MKILGRVIASLLIALVVGVIAGALPLLWLWWAVENETPGDATGDMIFIILPLAAVFAVVAFGATLLITLIIFLWKAKSSSRK